VRIFVSPANKAADTQTATHKTEIREATLLFMKTFLQVIIKNKRTRLGQIRQFEKEFNHKREIDK